MLLQRATTNIKLVLQPGSGQLNERPRVNRLLFSEFVSNDAHLGSRIFLATCQAKRGYPRRSLQHLISCATITPSSRLRFRLRVRP